MIKKATFGAVLILLIVLATAGSVAGVYLLQSHTDVHDNTIDSKNIVISSNDYTDILTSVNFDTANADDTVTYTLRATNDLDGDEVNESALISSAFTVRVVPTNLTSSEITSGFNLTVTVSGFTPVSGLTYILVVGSQSVAITSGNVWTFTSVFNYNTDLAVALYVKGSTTTNPGANVGFTNYSADPAVEGSIFTFTATSVA